MRTPESVERDAVRGIAFIGAVFVLLATVSAVSAEAPDREAIIQALIERSRLLEDTHFAVPKALWKEYLRDTVKGEAPPVGFILTEGRYSVDLPKDSVKAKLTVRLSLQVLDPEQCFNLPLLHERLVWKDIQLDGKPARAALSKGWLCFTFTEPGERVLTAEAALAWTDFVGTRLSLDVPRSVCTLLRFDSPDAWQIDPEDDVRRIRGAAGGPLPAEGLRPAGGTHGEIAFTPRERLVFTCRRPEVTTDRPPKFQLRGDVTWNLDAGTQQVAANLEIAILGGTTDRLELRLPPDAERVSVSGSDVRETRLAPGVATVFLHGRITEKTTLSLAYDRPRSKGPVERFEEFSLTDGRWAGGTFVVTNTAGGSELLPSVVSGLRDMALAEIPPSASSMLAGPPSLAYEITAPQWSAAAELLSLGEFALTESIADLAHYEVAVRPDGTMMGKGTYEVRNRHRQFLRVTLPKGAQVLLARVNEQPRHLIPAAGESDVYLLPLVRSKASVEGLVSFPVEVVFLARIDALPVHPDGTARLPLPRIDIPIAYAWCETCLPEGVGVRKWWGPLRQVERFSSETAAASLEYGSSQLAEGYSRRIGTIAERPPTAPEPATVPPPEPPTRPKTPAPAAQPQPEQKPPGEDPYVRARLAKNYYRAGKDFYDSDDFENAGANLRKVVELLPGSVEAANAKRLLANIKLAAGELELQSKAQKAAGVQVLSSLKQAREQVTSQQEQLVAEGFKALREGDKAVAFQKLAAAEDLSKSVLSKGESVRELSARLGKAREVLKEITEERTEQASVLHEEVKKLASAGRFEEAIRKSAEIVKIDPGLDTIVRGNIARLTVEAARKHAEEVKRDFARDVTVQTTQAAQGYAPDIGTVQRERIPVLSRIPIVGGVAGGGGRAVTGAQPRRPPYDLDDLWVERVPDAEAEKRSQTLEDLTAMRAQLLETVRLDQARRTNRYRQADQPSRSLETRLEEVDREIEREKVRLAQLQPGTPQWITSGGHLRGRAVGGGGGGTTGTDVVWESLAKAEAVPSRTVPEAMRREATTYLRLLPAQPSREEATGKLREQPEAMKNERRLAKERLDEQWKIFFDRDQYDDALVVLDRMAEIDPEDLTVREKIRQTTQKKSETGLYQVRGAQQRETDRKYNADVRRMTPWYPMATYPQDWKELSDRRLGAVGAARTDESPDDRKVRSRLDETIVSFTFDRQPVEEAIDLLQTLGSVNIVLDRGKFSGPGKTVTLKLTNVPLATAVKLLTEQLGLEYTVRDGVVFISDRRGIKPEAETDTYDVRDLLGDVPKFTSGTFELQNISARRDGKRDDGRTSIFGADEEDADAGTPRTQEESLNNLTDLIRQVVGAGTWEQGTGNVIRGRAGSIIVTHTPETQAKVQKLLADLRRTKGPQVQLGEKITEQRARGILTMTNGQRLFLGDVGFDFTGQNAPAATPHYVDTNGDGVPDTSTGLEYRPSRAPAVSDELKRFIETNYAWRWAVKMGPADRSLSPAGTVSLTPAPGYNELEPGTPSYITSGGHITWGGRLKEAEEGEGGGGDRLAGKSWGGYIRGLQRTGLDVVFCVDATGSMGGIILETKTRIRQLIKVITYLVPNARVGVVAYRDRKKYDPDDYEWTVKYLPLLKCNAEGVDKLQRFLRETEAFGGGDIREAVLEGVECAIQRSGWDEGSKKVIIVFGDAPPHHEDNGLAKLYDLCKTWHDETGGIISCIDTTGGSKLMEEFKEMARQGGGEASFLNDERAIIRHLVVLIFGSRWATEIDKVYASVLKGGEEGGPQPGADLSGRGVTPGVPEEPRTALDRREAAVLSDIELAAKLRQNLEQKVSVSSVNLNADAERARSLGVRFTVGNNGLAYALIDEAEFRTLKEFSDTNGETPPAELNPRSQDTIVGTAALIANGMLGEVRWAGDLANTLDILDNPVKLAHRQYVLIDNGRFLTAVRAGAMQHWTEASRPVFFVSVPQEIDVPHVGQLVRFEKTLIEPEDELVIQAHIYWKGGVP